MYDYLDGKLNQGWNSDQMMDEVFRIGLSYWQVPQGPNYWAEMAYQITGDCMVRDKIFHAGEYAGDEFLRAAENYYWYYSLNTHYAEVAFWAGDFWEENSVTS